MLTRQLDGQLFQGCADLEDVFQVLHSQIFDQDAAMGQVLDPAFFLQLQNGPPDRCPADLQLRSQLPFAQYLAAGIYLIEEPLFNRFVYLYLQGLIFILHGHKASFRAACFSLYYTICRTGQGRLRQEHANMV